DWSTIGILLGTIAFIRGIIRDIKRWKERPKLRVEFNPKLPSDLGYYRYVDLGIIRKFGCVRVRNIGKSLALRCVATLEILKYPGIQITSIRSIHFTGLILIIALKPLSLSRSI
ncbi:MAG: hypothetical protein QMD78_02830, partial [Methanocellales archaeon]|nr:hypothetical protein [Methanocellales archaeon]